MKKIIITFILMSYLGYISVLNAGFLDVVRKPFRVAKCSVMLASPIGIQTVAAIRVAKGKLIDKERCKAMTDLANNIAVFAGLYATVVTSGRDVVNCA